MRILGKFSKTKNSENIRPELRMTNQLPKNNFSQMNKKSSKSFIVLPDYKTG